MKTINEKNSVKNNQVINDFGQKIGGAHKDRAREAAEKLAGVDASALILQPLSKVAKLPDLRALFLSGAITEHVARLAWYYWSCIGTKPGSSWPTRLQRWADRAAALIQSVADVLAYGTSEKSPIFESLEGWKPAQTWDLFNDEMTAANWPEDEYKRGAYFVGRYWMNPARYSIHTEKASYYTAFDTVADAVAAIRAKVDKNTTKAPQKFSMYQTSAGVYYITPKGKAGIKLAEFTNKAEAWAAYGDTEKLGKIYDELRKFPSERRDWNRPRLGEDWRQGRDMSPESFAEVFPFRGVEFGNWVNQTERAACLNEAADALQDLAAVIGIRPEAVALGGSLAWAFGSRGVGKALAHYEPARRVVNLTKKKGNGCVAHEWFHALDNYMMIQAGRPSLMAVSDCHAYGDAEKSPIFAAAYELKSALLKSEMYTRSRRIDEFRSSPYWATVTEMAARAFEAVIYYKLEAAGMCNDYLVNFKPSDEWNRAECYPYPTKEEAAQLAPLFDAFILAAFTEAERAPMVEPSAGLLPEPPAVVTYDPAQPIESAPFHVQDEAPAVAASEPMNAEEDEAPTPSDGVQGAAYGDAEKSQIFDNIEESARILAYHQRMKREHPEAVILYRMGNFYESYFQDAQTVADCTGVIVRKHHGTPVAGFPFHALDTYLPRLVRAGHRVAICDDPRPTTPTDGGKGAAYGNSEKSQNSAKPRRKSVHDIYTQYCRLRDELIRQCYPLNGVHLVRADKISEVYDRYINNIHKFMKSEEWDKNKPFIREFYMLYRRPDVATLNKSMHICELDGKEFIDMEGKAHTYGRSSFGFFIPKKGWVSMPGDDGLPYSTSRETLKKIMDDGGYINFDGFQFVWPVMRGRDRSKKPVQPASIARKEWLEFKIHAMKVPFGCRQYVYEFIEKSLISAPDGVEWRIRHDSIWGIELKVDGVYFTVAYAFGGGGFNFSVVDVSSRFPSGICSPLSWCRYLDAALSEHRIPMSWPRPTQFYAVEYHLPFEDEPVFAG